MIRTIQNGQTIMIQTQSAREVCALQSTPSNEGHPIYRAMDPEATRVVSNSDWLGLPRGECLRVLNGEGWPEGGKRMESAMQGIYAETAPPSSFVRRRRKQWSETGDECSADRILNGDYDRIFLNRRYIECESFGKITRMFVSVNGSVKQEAEELFWSGACAMCICDALEAIGGQVEIYACSYNTDVFRGGMDAFSICRVKSAGEPANPDQIAASLCLAAFCRYALFGSYLAVEGKKVLHNTGIPCSVNQEVLQSADLWADGDIIIPRIHTQAAARDFACRILSISNEKQFDVPPSKPHTQISKGDQSEPSPPKTETSRETPTCPDCGRIMRMRTAKRGAHAGNAFWGCSGYPVCKGTRGI